MQSTQTQTQQAVKVCPTLAELMAMPGVNIAIKEWK
jgi:hypothetical protein